jgi:branched-chain amino acid transport system permease protein
MTRNRIILWAVLLAALVAAPLVFSKGFAVSLLCQTGILVIFALSYNMQLGQTGLLSFGHAVYYGLGALFSIHVLNMGKVPTPLIPFVGGAAGLVFGLLFGYITTRRAGTTFAMITMGVGEMVAACSLMFPAFFGGEAGISGNRALGEPLLGLTFGSQVQVYYLVAIWLVACMALMHAITRTPLGRIANAVRDNPERAQFVGYDPQTVRFLMVTLSGFFAGVSGGLAAINYEIVSAESLSALTSGQVLLATFLGGVGFFAGPVVGAVVVTLMSTVLAAYTQAWPFYFGLLFLVMVLFAPGGLASLAVAQRRLWEAGALRHALAVYARLAIPVLIAVGAAVLAVEMTYRGVRSTGAWLGTAAVLACASIAARWIWVRSRERWALASTALEAKARA